MKIKITIVCPFTERMNKGTSYKNNTVNYFMSIAISLVSSDASFMGSFETWI